MVELEYKGMNSQHHQLEYFSGKKSDLERELILTHVLMLLIIFKNFLSPKYNGFWDKFL